jgi:hypothetical protein
MDWILVQLSEKPKNPKLRKRPFYQSTKCNKGKEAKAEQSFKKHIIIPLNNE